MIDNCTHFTAGKFDIFISQNYFWVCNFTEQIASPANVLYLRSISSFFVVIYIHKILRSKEFSSQHHLPEHEKWANEYIEEQLTQKATGDVQQVAKNMTEELTDPDIAATEFMQFVKKLSTGEAAIEGNQVGVYNTYTYIEM